MPGSGQFGSAGTDLFRSAWRPKKAVTILWRRVETLSPDAYAELMAWVETYASDGAPWRWLELMATNEVAIEPVAALAELARLRQRRLPEPVAAHAELLRDLIWEASEPTSDWLQWRPCRLCGRRWAVTEYENVLLCPRHRNPAALRDYLREEAERFPGLVDHATQRTALAAPASNGLGAATPSLNGGHRRQSTGPNDLVPALELPAVPPARSVDAAGPALTRGED